MTKEQRQQIQRDADGFRGTFHAVNVEGADDLGDVLYTREGESLDPDNNETFYTIATRLDYHIAETIARMLNSTAPLLAEINRLHDETVQTNSALRDTISKDPGDVARRIVTASWPTNDQSLKSSDWRSQRDQLREQLAAMTAARDDLADIADDLNGDNGDDDELHRRREEIAALRLIGSTGDK